MFERVGKALVLVAGVLLGCSGAEHLEDSCGVPRGAYSATYVLTEGPAGCPQLPTSALQANAVGQAWPQLWAGSGPLSVAQPAPDACTEAWAPVHYTGGTLVVQKGYLRWGEHGAEGQLAITDAQGASCTYALELEPVR